MRKLILVMFAFILLAGINVSNAQTASLPYAINFGTSQTGWTAVDESTSPGTTWEYKPRWAYIQGVYYGSIMISMDCSSTCNDYYISPMFTLQSGTTYTVEYNACMQQDGDGANVAIGYARSSSDMSTYTKMTDLVLDDNSEYPAAQTVEVTVPEDGDYCFVFHNTSPQFNSTVFLFEFKLYEGEGTGETPKR